MNSDYSNIMVIIVAAGSGTRFGSALPKQFCLLDGVPVVLRSIMNFREALPGCRVVTVLSADYVSEWDAMCGKYGIEPTLTAIGGATRWQSVKNALTAVGGSLADGVRVLVHDGVRPLAGGALIRRVAEGLDHAVGVIPVTPVTDSLRRVVHGDDVESGRSVPVDRTDFVAVQTPQGFRGREFSEAYGIGWRPEFTDDASVMAAAGFDDIRLVEGDPRNIKITHPDDIAIASLYLNR